MNNARCSLGLQRLDGGNFGTTYEYENDRTYKNRGFKKKVTIASFFLCQQMTINFV